jgi:hypothetical protein
VSGQRASLTAGYIGMGLARNELMTPSVKRVGLRSPHQARSARADDQEMGAMDHQNMRPGCAIMSPNRSIGRVQDASLPSESCVRTSL